MQFKWFLKGVQSGIAHYLACQPCDERRRRKQMAEESRKTRAREEDIFFVSDKCHPELVYREGIEYKPGMYYPQPAAGEVNKAWYQAVPRNPIIDPANPPKYMTKPNRSIGVPKSAFRKSVRNPPTKAINAHTVTSISTKEGIAEKPVPDAQAVADGKESVKQWKEKTRHVYEREDEHLWTDKEYVGAKQHVFKDLGVVSKDPNLGYTGLQGPDMLRPPLINKDHPPNAPNPATNPAGISWVFQPVPAPEVMEGKVPPPKRKEGGYTPGCSSEEPSLRGRVVASVLAAAA